ncbi:MAG: pyridoxal 5'-phosphate synthase lyase subunit PdxS [Candidatus Anstonellaceae archaeon]
MDEKYLLKTGLAKMLKGGVIMDVTNAKEAKIAQKAGAVAVMALEKVPADIRREGKVARMADPQKIKEIKKAVSIPVMAKCRIGHFVEAQILEALEVDFIDESEVLSVADETQHINKWEFSVPFVCGAKNLGQALRRIEEGAAMIRTKGEAGTGNISEAIKHIRTIQKEIESLEKMSEEQLEELAREYRIKDLELLKETKKLKRLPVVNFAAGGIATPADAALCMQLGMDGVFVGSGIFKSQNPLKRAQAIVKAVANYNDKQLLAKISEGLGKEMEGIEIDKLSAQQRLAERGD